MSELIIINLYGSILPLNRELKVRDGFFDFLERYKSKKFAISAYEPKDKVESDIESAGLKGKVEKVYSIEDMAYLRQVERYNQRLRDWALADFNIPIGETLCISNNVLDIESAKWYNVKLIQIPHFKDMQDKFSFNSVSVDSWVSGATYFFQRLNGKQQKIVLE